MKPVRSIRNGLVTIFLFMLCHPALNAQSGSSPENADRDSLQSFSGNGKFYQIFPLVHGKVVYTDSVLASGKSNRESFLDKAKIFFSNHEDAKYDFQPENPGNGIVTYEGKLKKSSFSVKSDVYFNIDLDCSNSSCQFNLYEIVFASSRPANSTGAITGMDGQAIVGGSKTNTMDKAVYLENIPFDQGEFSKKYCEKLDGRLMEIMRQLKAALR